jgi:hypothetical protein
MCRALRPRVAIHTVTRAGHTPWCGVRKADDYIWSFCSASIECRPADNRGLRSRQYSLPTCRPINSRPPEGSGWYLAMVRCVATGPMGRARALDGDCAGEVSIFVIVIFTERLTKFLNL